MKRVQGAVQRDSSGLDSGVSRGRRSREGRHGGREGLARPPFDLLSVPDLVFVEDEGAGRVLLLESPQEVPHLSLLVSLGLGEALSNIDSLEVVGSVQSVREAEGVVDESTCRKHHLD